MDSNSDVFEHESSAKRLKLDVNSSNIGELCNGGDFSSYFTLTNGPIDHFEGLPTDCDSGYEATLESMPSCSHQTSPDPGGDAPDSDIFLTPSRNADTSQDSIEDDNVSTVSEISGLSDLSGQDWKPMAKSLTWIQKQMASGVDPRTLLLGLGVDSDDVPAYVEKETLWKLIINMLAEPPRRHKLRHVNSLDDVVRLVKGAKNIIVLTGAGVSVSCGIPDFRSRNGIYERLAKDFPNLPDPQAMFDINFFSQDPRPFFKFARDIYPGKFKPSPCHDFIKMLENSGKLLRNYTQNIDTLEKVADISRVIECHGSFATATCTNCANRVTADEIRDIVLSQHIPLCTLCHPGRRSVPSICNDPDDETNYRALVSSGVMKPDIVFFGEGLPDTFHDAMARDKAACDLLLVVGSSLKVRPVALIPSSLPACVPQILINREPLPHCDFDVELLGDCDGIISHLCRLLGAGWSAGVAGGAPLEAARALLPPEDALAFADFEAQAVKERHASVDSARDSGIGDNSNFADSEPTSDECAEPEGGAFKMEEALGAPASSGLRGFWQPKVKRNLADRLPKDAFYCLKPGRYVFPGAELFYDPDEKFRFSCAVEGEEENSSSESDESDCENDEGLKLPILS